MPARPDGLDPEAKVRSLFADAEQPDDSERAAAAILAEVERVQQYAVRRGAVYIRTPHGLTMIEPHPDKTHIVTVVHRRREAPRPTALSVARDALRGLVRQLERRGDPVDLSHLVLEEETF